MAMERGGTHGGPTQLSRRYFAATRYVVRALLARPIDATLLAHLGLMVRHPRTFALRVRDYLRRVAHQGGYDEWVRQFDTLAPEDLAPLRTVAQALDNPPLLSVVMPVYNPPQEHLRSAIESIRGQIYSNWEICIADDGSTASHVRPLLQHYEGIDARIRVCYRQENGGVCAASNSALELASGAYVALVDHDDVLPPHALLIVAKCIADNPDVDLIYTDEDKIDEAGERFDPYFKPDWNPALILSQNFFNHLGVYRRSLLERVGGFRAALSGSQDHDLVLRCADLTTADRIKHIPQVLYHWRAAAGSAARSSGAKPYAVQAGQRAVQDALDRRGLDATVEITRHNYYQVSYRAPAKLPEVSVLIPTACQSDLVVRCVRSLLEITDYPHMELLLLVNERANYSDAERSVLEEVGDDPRLRVLFYDDRPFNFSWVNNWGAAQARGCVLCFVNDDTQAVSKDWLSQMVARLSLEKVGAVGAMLYYPDDTVQHAGTILGVGGVADHAHRGAPRYASGYFGRAALEQDLSCVTAGCMAVSREAFDSVGGFDEKLAIAFNDVDFCIRLRRAGWRIVWTPAVEFYHHESATVGPPTSAARAEQFRGEVQFMINRWGSALVSDPFYNPNLSLDAGGCFELSFPPRADWKAHILQLSSPYAGNALAERPTTNV